MAASRRPLGPGIVALIVLDTVLVVVLVVMLLQAGIARSGRPAADTPTTPSPTEAAAEPTPTAAPPDGTPVDFALPSRNIGCRIDAGEVTCAIEKFSYAPPTVPGCTGETGFEIRLTADGAEWLCTPGDPPGKASRDAEVLDYGTTTTAHGFTCESSSDGVACRHDASGHSFSLARGGATLD